MAAMLLHGYCTYTQTHTSPLSLARTLQPISPSPPPVPPRSIRTVLPKSLFQVYLGSPPHPPNARGAKWTSSPHVKTDRQWKRIRERSIRRHTWHFIYIYIADTNSPCVDNTRYPAETAMTWHHCLHVGSVYRNLTVY